jgi:hypothetical protein
VGLERGPLNNVTTIEKLLARKIRGSGLQNLDHGLRGSATVNTGHLSIRKSWH